MKKQLLTFFFITSNLLSDSDIYKKTSSRDYDFNLILSGFTKYFNTKEKFNEKNYGVGL